LESLLLDPADRARGARDAGRRVLSATTILRSTLRRAHAPTAYTALRESTAHSESCYLRSQQILIQIPNCSNLRGKSFLRTSQPKMLSNKLNNTMDIKSSDFQATYDQRNLCSIGFVVFDATTSLPVALKLMIPAFGLFKSISSTAPGWFNDQTVSTVTMPWTILHLGPIGDAMCASKTSTRMRRIHTPAQGL
ncbi:hypothetical protein CT0861_01017, partial [Colletotrichum tofieldiae]